MFNGVNVIFHHPLPLNNNAKSASGIRPIKMLSAFKDLGCRVDLVTGYSDERKRCIRNIMDNVSDGVVYNFVYSESSTMPTILSDTHHLPLNPLLDYGFFLFCKKNNIPISLFYRDIYWAFDNYGDGINSIKSAMAKLAYRFDLWVYQKTVTKLYLPSLEMGDYVPYVSSNRFSALPPGHVSPKATRQPVPDLRRRPLKLFYVGGMSSHYQMHELFIAITRLPSIELTICTRESEWISVRHEYPDLTSNIRIVHLSGVEMEEYLQSCDIAVLFVKPQEYREFASPVKLYEYVGFQKPIIASEGTLAGRFVKENGIGWSLPYNIDSISVLLQTLVNNPDIFESIYDNLQQVAPLHSWKSRAEQVIKDLSQ